MWEDLWYGTDEVAQLRRANIRQLAYDITIYFGVGTDRKSVV